jgi:hypothetical protein
MIENYTSVPILTFSYFKKLVLGFIREIHGFQQPDLGIQS